MIDNTQNYIDSRDVIEYRDELVEELAEMEDEHEIAELEAELERLDDFIRQGEDLSEWEYGVSLIHEDFFEEYIQELYEDIGDINPDSSLYNYINWTRVAEDAMLDYTEITFDGVDYYARG